MGFSAVARSPSKYLTHLLGLRAGGPPLNRDAFDARVVGRAETHQFGIVLERIVNDPAIVGIHWLQLDRASS